MPRSAPRALCHVRYDTVPARLPFAARTALYCTTVDDGRPLLGLRAITQRDTTVIRAACSSVCLSICLPACLPARAPARASEIFVGRLLRRTSRHYKAPAAVSRRTTTARRPPPARRRRRQAVPLRQTRPRRELLSQIAPLFRPTAARVVAPQNRPRPRLRELTAALGGKYAILPTPPRRPSTHIRCRQTAALYTAPSATSGPLVAARTETRSLTFARSRAFSHSRPIHLRASWERNEPALLATRASE